MAFNKKVASPSSSSTNTPNVYSGDRLTEDAEEERVFSPQDDLAPVAGLYKIAGVTLNAQATNIDFQSIPQEYEALRLVVCVRSTASSTFDNLAIEFNNDQTDANYFTQHLQAGSTTVSGGQNIGGSGARRSQLVP